MEGKVTLFEAAGGQPFFDRLVRRFYEGVAADEVLRPMYPEDLEPSARHLALFLGQYWGGPPAYQEERGHPRLRLRHAPFPIDARASARWLVHMREAVEREVADPELRATLVEYFEYAADSLRNVEEPG